MSVSSATITLWVTRSRVGAAVRILAGALALLAPAAGASAGTTERVSVDSGGNEANGESRFRPAISADGSFVAFTSFATNLVPADGNRTMDVFVHDRSTGVTERVSVDGAGNQGDRSSYDPSISADGRFVAFASSATNLVPGDAGWRDDVFVHDRWTGATERVSVDSAGNPGDDSSYSPSISADGRFVAFRSRATNLVAGDTNGSIDVFVHDRWTGATERVSVDSDGNQATGDRYSPAIADCYNPALSADGRFVAFASLAANLVPGDTNGSMDVFVHDRQTGTTERVSVDSAGTEMSYSDHPAISADGRFVTFDTVYGVFVRDRWTGSTDLVSPRPVAAMDGSSLPSISADGRFVVFWLTGRYSTGVDDVLVYDRQTGTTERVGVDSSSTLTNGKRYGPAISADGSFVAFNSAATDLVVGDSNNLIDVFVHDRRRAAADTAPPPQTNGRPSGTQPAGTAHATITSRTAP